MRKRLKRALFRLLTDMDDDLDARPCNDVGHSWGAWQDTWSNPRATSVGAEQNELRIQLRQKRTCQKCGQMEFRSTTVGYVTVTSDNSVRARDA